MTLAISISGSSIDSPFDSRFGRAAAFCVVDGQTHEWSAYKNPAVQATGGAGVQAAQFVTKLGVGAVVSGAFGPNAFSTLHAAGVAMYTVQSARASTAREVLELFERGELTETTAAADAGHRRGRR